MSAFGLWLRSLFTPCPWHLRRLGYLREQLAIEARYQRNRTTWDPHLTASRAAVLHAASLCRDRRTAVILGAGLLHDVPLAELATTFHEVILADILHLPKNRRLAVNHTGQVRCLEFDCTAAVAPLWQQGKGIPDDQAVALFREAAPTLPAEVLTRCDLIVSMNLASQLGYLPADWLLDGRRRGAEFSLALRRAAALRHIDWLRGLAGVRLMIADRAVVVRERDESEAEREVILTEADLGPPEESWVWRLAPIPEWDRRHHLEMEVGVWCFRGRPAPPDTLG